MEQKETIKIKYLNDKIEKLCYIDGKSDWIDLRAAEDVTLKKGEFAMIHLGVCDPEKQYLQEFRHYSIQPYGTDR